MNPLMLWDMATTKDRARADREVKLASVAPIETVLAGRQAFSAGTGRALRTIRPKAILQILACSFLVGEKLEQLECADGEAAHSRSLGSGLHKGHAGQRSHGCVFDAPQRGQGEFGNPSYGGLLLSAIGSGSNSSTGHASGPSNSSTVSDVSPAVISGPIHPVPSHVSQRQFPRVAPSPSHSGQRRPMASMVALISPDLLKIIGVVFFMSI